jgi:N6-L-threonylcarbamoyladenine synthase/N6-L-threonylcarbamoyladenine synthase/protein kinase Bud32
MDVSFSGILTAAENLIGKESIEDICYSLQENCFSMLTEVTERAMAHLEKREVLLGGGVARNQRLKEMISSMAEERGATCFYPKDDLLVDNGAMIAWLGILMWESGIRMEIEETGIDQNFRTDEVEVRWH